jgi:Flp pilus assembly protein TadD
MRPVDLLDPPASRWYGGWVSTLLVGLFSALMATNQSAAVSNTVRAATGISVNVPNPNDPVEKAFQALMEIDDAAQTEADALIKAEHAKIPKEPTFSQSTLKLRLDQCFEPVRRAYDDFLKRHPDHARARVAYASFLSDTGKEGEAKVHLDEAARIDPKNPAVFNNLANYYGHNGPVTNAFACYAKAIELNPREPIYLQNYATTVYLFRQDAIRHFGLTEEQVFAKALDLYHQALALDPTNFVLASDLAQSYYGMRPRKTTAGDPDRAETEKIGRSALAAWEGTLKLARDEVERQGVLVHLARWHLTLGHFQEVRASLAGITDPMYNTIKDRLNRNLVEKETGKPYTNTVPEQASAPVAQLPTNSAAPK